MGVLATFPAGHSDDQADAQREKIRDYLSEAGKTNIRYDAERYVLSFMGTVPDDMAIEGYQTFLLVHPNNLGEHTRHNSELGFSGTQQLEREVIGMLGDLHGDPAVDGYLSSGGTEANIQGCWVGREWLINHFAGDKDNRVCLLVTQFYHYSVAKAYHVLRLDGGFVKLPTDNKQRAVLVPEMEKEIRRRYDEGQRRFIIVAVAGSTLLVRLTTWPPSVR